MQIKRAPAHSKNPLKLTIMTHVANFTASASLNNTNTRMEYMVEVVTFDGDSQIVYVETDSSDEAQEIAASMVADADYTMVQGSWVA